LKWQAGIAFDLYDLNECKNKIEINLC